MATIDYKRSLQLLLKPIVAFCLRRGIKVPEVIDTIKSLFLELATEEIKRENKTTSLSKISAMTGIHRKFIPDLQDRHREPEQKTRNNFIKILGQWQGDKRFKNANGSPKILTSSGLDSEFAKLVFSVSADLNPFTVLAELIRIGVVERTVRGVALREEFFLARSSIDDGMKVAADDLSDLIKAVEDNTLFKEEVSHLHLSTEYDNIPEQYLPKIRQWLLKEGSKFHKKARAYFSKYDLDINKSLKQSENSKVVKLCAFSMIRDKEKNENENID